VTFRHLAPLVLVVLHGAAAPGPVATAAPSVTGVLQQGKQLTATPGTWTGSGTVATTFQWYRCDANGAHCASVHGATRATYTQVAKDVGGTLGVTVRATDPTGTTAAYAPLAGLVAPKTATLLASAQPAVIGMAAVGRPLTVATPRWSTPATSTYVWERCNANGRLCTPIAGATTQTYTATGDDIAHTLLAAVTGAAGGARQTVLSLPTAAVQPVTGPSLAARPSVAGVLQQGQRLTARTGTWLGSGPITYAFQWYRCDANAAHCKSIHGATKATYAQVAKDAGGSLGVTVRATDATGTATAYAPVAGVVAAAGSTLAVTRQPALTGVAAVGQKLAVKPGAWTVMPSATTLGWLRCNPNGRACIAIDGASTATYTVTAADSGHALTAAVHATAGTASATALAVASLPVP
jgi:Ig domain of plant-specific actin-binding protein